MGDARREIDFARAVDAAEKRGRDRFKQEVKETMQLIQEEVCLNIHHEFNGVNMTSIMQCPSTIRRFPHLSSKNIKKRLCRRCKFIDSEMKKLGVEE